MPSSGLGPLGHSRSNLLGLDGCWAKSRACSSLVLSGPWAGSRERLVTSSCKRLVIRWPLLRTVDAVDIGKKGMVNLGKGGILDAVCAFVLPPFFHDTTKGAY